MTSIPASVSYVASHQSLQSRASLCVVTTITKPTFGWSSAGFIRIKPAATPSTVTESPASAPLLSSLPEAFQQSLPKLQMEVHSYAADPADRFVVINMQRYVAGDTLKEGPHVIAVTSDGVILDYRGTRFMLPRN